MIETLCEQIPKSFREKSGKVFYSGRSAFSSSSAMYILGLNPGGDPTAPREYTIESHSRTVLDGPADWSAYRDESWGGLAPGEAQLQRRVLHLLKGVGLNPGLVPSSNLVFLRSKRAEDIANEFKGLAESCWPFHSLVIKSLKPKVVLCFGQEAGNYVRLKLGALKLQAEWLEENERKWRNRVFANSIGIRVAILTHPGRADWTSVSTDPTNLVREALR